jgi:hypothetical protein
MAKLINNTYKNEERFRDFNEVAMFARSYKQVTIELSAHPTQVSCCSKDGSQDT